MRHRQMAHRVRARADPAPQGHRRLAAAREDPRRRGAEGHRQVDRDRIARTGHAGHPYRRGGVRAMPLGSPGPAHRRVDSACWAERSQVHRRPRGLPRFDPPGSVRLEGRLVRARLHADGRGGEAVRLEAQLRRDLADVAWRVHHPLGVPRQDQRGLRHRPGAAQPTSCALLHRSARKVPGRMASGALPKALPGVRKPAGWA